MSIVFFNDTATTEIYTLSLHDALPICRGFSSVVRSGDSISTWMSSTEAGGSGASAATPTRAARAMAWREPSGRSGEHTSELQSRQYLVCRLLLEKKKHTINISDQTLVI